MSRTYAIIDCETTGFGKADRMLEVAVVVLDGATRRSVELREPRVRLEQLMQNQL